MDNDIGTHVFGCKPYTTWLEIYTQAQGEV